MNSRIELIQGDITKLDADAIVNAANSLLMGGGGVDGAIHRAGGLKIAEECRLIREQQGGCPAGSAVITSGGNLLARYVIHAVGPIWEGGNKNESQLLASAYEKSLKIAQEKNLETIAFPNISTGVYGFPKEEASEIAIQTIKKFLNESEFPKKVIFVCFDEENYGIYKRKLQQDI